MIIIIICFLYEYVPQNMTSDSFNLLKSLFTAIWALLGSFNIPGTTLTGQHILVGPLGALVFITALKKVMDIGAVSISSHIKASGKSSAYSNKEE